MYARLTHIHNNTLQQNKFAAAHVSSGRVKRYEFKGARGAVRIHNVYKYVVDGLTRNENIYIYEN